MAGTITYDIDGSRFIAGESGNLWNRRYLIQGMTSGPSIPSLIAEAYALIPDTGTAAPAPIVNMFVRDANIERIWCEDPTAPGTLWSAEGVINYSTPTRVGGTIGEPDDNGAGVTLTSSAAVQEVTVREDITSTRLETTFDNATMAHEAQGFEVSNTFTFTRLESSNPRGRSDTHTGTLNDAIWNGYAANTVLCASIESDTDDNGASYVVTYTFTYRPGGWQIEVVHDDPFFPGHPLPGATGDAIKTFDVIPTSNFGLLSISLP